jgi:stress responsive alpha/beta barrel protein
MRVIALAILGVALLTGVNGPARPEAPVLHVVLFTLGPGGDATTLAADCRRLLKDIPGVDEVRVGAKAVDDRDVHVKDYDVALLVRLHRLGDLPGYQAHPRHRELVDAWRPKARWRVIDFYGE